MELIKTKSSKVNDVSLDVESQPVNLGSYVPVEQQIPSSPFKKKGGQDIAWSGVSFKAGNTQILSDCYGQVPAGKVCAIMGPSGAGKSSLLNVLAGRSAPAPGISIGGTVTVAGKKINPVRFRQQIAYVMQDDALMPTATPREAFEFSALLRLPAHMPRDQIRTLVNQTVTDLGLDSCADTMIDGSIAYFLSKIALELPMTFIQTLVQFIIAYYMIDFQGNFMYLVVASWGLGCASCSVAVMLGCLLSDVKDVTEMAPLLFVPQLLFAGFFIRTSQIPVFLRWAQYLCSIKYTMNLVLMTEFSASSPSCSDPLAHTACKKVLTDNDIVTGDWWIYMLILIALFICFRTIGALVLVKKAQRFY